MNEYELELQEAIQDTYGPDAYEYTTEEAWDEIADARHKDSVGLSGRRDCSQFGTPTLDKTIALTSEEEADAAKLYDLILGVDDIEDDPAAVIIPGMLIAGGRTVLSGRTNHGKSALAAYLAHQIAAGGNFLGLKIAARPVLYLDRENSISGLRNFQRWLGVKYYSKKNRKSQFLHRGLHSQGVPLPNDKIILAWAKSRRFVRSSSLIPLSVS